MRDAQRLHMNGAALAIAALALSACGGGGGGGGGNPTPSPNPPAGSGWVAGQFAATDSFAAQCASPRTGTDPNGFPYPDTQGTRLAENNWLRSWTNELYLWYDEVVDRDPGGIYDDSLAGTLEYFRLLRTTDTTPSGAPKDKFHFTWDTTEWENLSQSGISAGYGAEFAILSNDLPRELVVVLTQPGSSATSPGVELARGDRIIEVDGADLVNGTDQTTIDTLNAGLFPSTIGESHTFKVEDLSDATVRTVVMTSQEITIDPVQFVTTVQSPAGANVGYLLFTDHIATSELQLVDAVNQLAAANIDDLVLDIRYNGGGFLAIASQLAYMIAGPNLANDQAIFEAVQFSDKHPNVNPVTGAQLQPYGFANVTLDLANENFPTTPLPSLELSRVYVLTSSSTCSASESIINSLRGIGVEVIQIGGTTCGKPYGFYPQDNCGTTYFSIQFRGVNALNFGDYTDGFAPSNTANDSTGADLPGCAVADDFDHDFADPAERMLMTALEFRDTKVCPDSNSPVTMQLQSRSEQTDAMLQRPPWRENRILGSW